MKAIVQNALCLLFVLGTGKLSVAQVSTTKVYRTIGQHKTSAEATISYQPISFKEQVFFALGSKVTVITSDGYKWNNKVYRAGEVPGLAEKFSKVGANFPTVTVKAWYKSSFRGEFKHSISGNMRLGALGDGFYVKCTNDEAKDLAGWRLEGVALHTFNYSPDPTIWNEIEFFLSDYESDQKTKRDFEALLKDADDLFARKDYVEARNKYFKAKTYKDKDPHIAQRLQQIKELLEKADKKKTFDTYMQYAEEHKAKKDYKAAQIQYDHAATMGVDNNLAMQQSRYMQNELDRLKLEEEQQMKKAKDEQDKLKKTDEENKKADQQTLKIQQQQLEELEKLKKENEQKALEQLEAEDRKRIEREQEEARKLEDEAYEKKQEEERKAADEKSKRRKKELDERIKSYEEMMEYDPVLLAMYYDEAEKEYRLSSDMRPSEALQIKESWWDGNGYMEDFRDELNEPKRQAAFEKHFELVVEQGQRNRKAQNLYFKALLHASKGSLKHKHIVNQIEWCDIMDEHKDDFEKAVVKNETSRRQIRESDKVIKALRRLEFNKERTMLAFKWANYANAYDKNGSYEKTSELAKQQQDLEKRLNDSQEQLLINKAIVGVSTGAVTALIIDESKSAQRYGNNSGGMNARLHTGFIGVPISINSTAEGYVPQSKPGMLITFPLIAELDIWILRNKYLDWAVSGGGIFGVYPFAGYKNTYFSYYGTGKLNLGYKALKVAMEGSYIQRTGKYHEDKDVALVDAGYEMVPGGVRGSIHQGKFNYSVLKLGGGLHLDFSNDEYEKYFRVLCHVEKPSFVGNSITKNPVFSYSGELVLGGGFSLAGEYAQNYVVGGIPEYEMENMKNKTYWAFKFGKVFTLIKSK